jgi:sulfatase maturation enzyme AslB (radical SAM superfamily)
MMKIDNERKMFTSNLILQSLKIKAFRKLLIGMAESRMKKYIAASDYPFLPEMVSYKAFTAFKNLLESIESNYEKGNISFGYIKKFIRTLALSSHTLPNESWSFKVRYGFDPPMFVLLSPTAVCNLNCAGCYADCDQKKRATLDFDICKRILKEKQAPWGSYFTVISGGEPFMYHDNGKTIFDLFEAFPDNLFLVYTNGSLINEKTAERLARTGNVTPAISVEGFEKETDERRGKGMHRKILNAMEHLRNAGVMFGLSVTLTSKNSDLFISDFDRFCEYYMDEQGAVFAWLFQYMPIGRDHDSFALLVPPEKRKALWEKYLVHERKKLKN